MNRKWLFGSGLVFGLVLSVVSLWLILNRQAEYRGVVIDPPVVAADFSLPDQNGGTFRLSEQRGKIVLIFFGYTHCPDICPITLSEFKRIKAALGKQAEQLVFVFITVDPERDTPQRLREYLLNFDPAFVGLSGSAEDLEQVYRAYGVYRQKQEVGSAGGYLVDHSTRIYLIDAQGNWRLNYPYGTPPEDIVSDIRLLFKRVQG